MPGLKSSTQVAILITIWVIIYGAIQFFIIDPAQARQEIPSILMVIAIDQPSHILLTFVLTAAIWFFFWFFDLWSEPPAKSVFRLILLSSFIFSLLGIISHDLVQYGLGVLLFILPVYVEPPFESKRDSKTMNGAHVSEKSRGKINWGMIQAIIALIALVWTLLTYYGLIP